MSDNLTDLREDREHDARLAHRDQAGHAIVAAFERRYTAAAETHRARASAAERAAVGEAHPDDLERLDRLEREAKGQLKAANYDPDTCYDAADALWQDGYRRLSDRERHVIGQWRAAKIEHHHALIVTYDPGLVSDDHARAAAANLSRAWEAGDVPIIVITPGDMPDRVRHGLCERFAQLARDVEDVVRANATDVPRDVRPIRDDPQA